MCVTLPQVKKENAKYTHFIRHIKTFIICNKTHLFKTYTFIDIKNVLARDIFYYSASCHFWHSRLKTFAIAVLDGYDELKENYSGAEKIPKCENLGWRDDFKFLFELCQAYKYYQQERKWPQVKWQKLSSLHSTRWNSRAIFALIAFFLIPRWRAQLKVTCDFIAGTWAKAWFSNQHHLDGIYDELRAAISKLNCPNF